MTEWGATKGWRKWTRVDRVDRSGQGGQGGEWTTRQEWIKVDKSGRVGQEWTRLAELNRLKGLDTTEWTEQGGIETNNTIQHCTENERGTRGREYERTRAGIT